MTRVLKIVMHGFKSFARRTEINFDNSFNCVLGPNGSGKSNVLDAICFVLGKSSAKGLRAEKSSNLVYNGGKKNDPAKEGKVSIYFDNTNKTFPSEEKVVKITRIVRQNGSSKYKINDKTRTRQQVVDLMAIAKINPDGYNIILQGDIGKFVEMSGGEKRSIIEEISGISVYEDKKEKALRELNRVEERLNEANIILKERKSYLKDLKGDRDQAQKYKELNDKIRQNKATYLKIQIDRKQKSKDKHEETIAKHRGAFDKFQETIAKSKEQIKQNRDKINEISKEVEEKGDKDQVRLQKEIEGIRVEIATNKTKIQSHRSEIDRIAHRKSQIQEDLKEVEGKIGELDGKVETLTERKKRREQERKELDSKIAEFKKKHKLDSDTAEIDKKIEEIDEESEKKQSEIQKLRERQQELLREQDKIEYQLASIDEQVSKVKEIEKEHKKELQRLQDMRSNFKKATLSLNKALDRSSTLAAEIKNCETKLHALREQHSKLTVKNAQIKETNAGNIAIQKILEMKKKEKGIYGTVGELGEVQSKYSQALEVAAGPRIRSIVVESDAVAAKCIKYLKTNKLGTATFLPLNKINPAESKASTKYTNISGCHGDASKLVKFDPKYKKIFSYVFGNTIVVDNIDVARRIGVGKARMATLTGDLVEQTGAMQGGYRKKSKGAGSFKEKELTTDLESVESKMAELEAAMSAYLKEKDSNEKEIVKLREEKATLEGDIIKTEKSLHLKSDDLDASMHTKKKLQTDLQAIEKDAQKILNDISRMNKELANMRVERQKLRAKVTSLKNPRLLAELNTFEERRRELTEELISIDAEIKGIKSQKQDIFGRDKENSSKTIKDIDKESASFKADIKKLEDTIKAQEKELKEKEKAQEKFYKKYKSLFAERSKLNDEISKIEIETAKVEEKSRQEEYKINTLQLELAKINAELGALQEDFQEYEGVSLDMKKREEDLKSEIKEFEKLKDKIGNVNLRALEIYESVEQEYNKLLEKHDKLSKEREDVLSMINEIETKKKGLFMETFNAINENFKRIFQTLSTKGKAYLEIENPENPFEAGLSVRVKLTGSKFMDIRSLSGGEKTMTALAFIFSIQEYEPATFYVMDEVDAALDKRNSETLSDLVKEYSKKAQYIIISHNDTIISNASSLFGVSMDEHGISKIVSLKI